MKDRFKKFLDFDDPNKLMPWKDKSPEPQGEEPEDRPEIAIKPAWYFVMYFIMGVGFDTLFPTNVFPEKVRFTLGAGLVLAGAILNATSLARFRKAHTNHETNASPRASSSRTAPTASRETRSISASCASTWGSGFFSTTFGFSFWARR